jgi:hypothetical protein
MIDPPAISSTEHWFGVQGTGDRWTLVRVVPRVAPGKPICTRTTDISVEGHDEVLFLVAGLQSLSEGPLTATSFNNRFVYPGESVHLGGKERGSVYLQVFGNAAPEHHDAVFLNYMLQIRQGPVTQHVASFERRTLGNPPTLIWAGDLDRDGRPDLVLNLPVGDVGKRWELFLSSVRSGGDLVSRAATFSTPGC